jgi:hypothetical protein
MRVIGILELEIVRANGSQQQKMAARYGEAPHLKLNKTHSYSMTLEVLKENAIGLVQNSFRAEARTRPFR